MINFNQISISAVFIKSNTQEITDQTILNKDDFASLFKDNILAQGTEIMNDGIKYAVDKFKIEMTSFDNFPNEIPSEPPYFYMKIFITKK